MHKGDKPLLLFFPFQHFLRAAGAGRQEYQVEDRPADDQDDHRDRAYAKSPERDIEPYP